MTEDKVDEKLQELQDQRDLEQQRDLDGDCIKCGARMEEICSGCGTSEDECDCEDQGDSE